MTGYQPGLGWLPAGWLHYAIPKAGDVIAYDYRALRVDSIAEFDGEKVVMQVTRLYGPSFATEDDRAALGLAWRGSTPRLCTFHIYQGGHVPLCACHGHPYPCRQIDSERSAAHELETTMARMQRADIPGCCYACGEVVTNRQASFRFQEGNAELPGYPGPLFHTRRECAGELERYRRVHDATYSTSGTVASPADLF